MAAILGSIIRHILTLSAGSLLAVGVSESQAHDFIAAAEPVVGGLVLYGGAQAWSIINKKKKKSK